MEKVISRNLWTEIRAIAQKARTRKAAIAYVTRDLIGFREGDLLVVDASKRAIGCGATDAKLLRNLKHRGVLLYSCDELHAKVLLLGDHIVVGSGNMSENSGGLVELAIMTSDSSTVSGIASFIHELAEQSDALDLDDIKALCRIPVHRDGGNEAAKRKKPKTKISKIGDRTWLIGTYELARDPSPREVKLIDGAYDQLESETGKSRDEMDDIRFGKSGRIVKECRPGDSVIQFWRSSSKAKRPSEVYKAAPVLKVQRTKHWTRVYLGQPPGNPPELQWREFKKLLAKSGYGKSISARTVRELDRGIAKALDVGWK